MELDEALAHLRYLDGEAQSAWRASYLGRAVGAVLSAAEHGQAIERRAVQVRGGYMPYGRAAEVAQWILTGSTEGA